MQIVGKIAVITGGASGMGAQTALYLSERGAKIAILDKDEEAAQKIASQIHGLAVKCNIVDEKEVEEAFKQIQENIGIPQICINCAGIAPAKRIVGREGPMPLSDFKKVIEVNLIGTFNVLRVAAALMMEVEPIDSDQERGVIINTASIAAYEGQIGQCAYSASKGGICSLTLPAARELGQHNIRVVTIAPGLFQTPLLESLPQEVQDGLALNITFPPRFGQPIEYAMLASHIIENSYINGAVLRLDGGLRMQAK
ncbi:MAG: SDR family NAD(P)-dependent oxidoreductase [Gammaproteobacteria bacterium]|nr:SDR family NAD(P)-dependent oxidoreductase [Gammaproteobacteria bacterium]